MTYICIIKHWLKSDWKNQSNFILPLSHSIFSSLSITFMKYLFSLCSILLSLCVLTTKPLDPQFQFIFLISKSTNHLQTVRSQRSENNTYRSILSTGRYSTDQPQHILSCQKYTSFSLTDFYSLPEVEIAVGCSYETNKGRILLYSLFYHSRGQQAICISLILLF